MIYAEKPPWESSDTVIAIPDKQEKYFSRQRFFNDYVYSETFKTPVLLQVFKNLFAMKY